MMSHDEKTIKDIKNKGQYHPNINMDQGIYLFLGTIVVIIRHLIKLNFKNL